MAGDLQAKWPQVARRLSNSLNKTNFPFVPNKGIIFVRFSHLLHAAPTLLRQALVELSYRFGYTMLGLVQPHVAEPFGGSAVLRLHLHTLPTCDCRTGLK